MSIRVLESNEDIDFAVDLTVKEGWNYTPKEIERMLALDPEGSFVYEEGKEPLGFVTCITCGRTGTVGHLVVSENARGKRIGDSLIRAGIDYMDSRDVESIVLFASSEGKRLYEKHGFTARDDILVIHSILDKDFQGRSSPECTPADPRDLNEIIAIDHELFGDDRSRLLKLLYEASPTHVFKLDRGQGIEGYIFGRPDHVGFDLGPWACLSRRPKDAESLFRTCLTTLGKGVVYIGVFARNAHAIRIAKSVHVDRTWDVPLMIRGEGRYEADARKLFAVTGLELG